VKFELDKFNGIIISKEELPSDVDTFKIELAEIVSFAKTENKNIATSISDLVNTSSIQ
jgi:hypothetical protein